MLLAPKKGKKHYLAAEQVVAVKRVLKQLAMGRVLDGTWKTVAEQVAERLDFNVSLSNVRHIGIDNGYKTTMRRVANGSEKPKSSQRSAGLQQHLDMQFEPNHSLLSVMPPAIDVEQLQQQLKDTRQDLQRVALAMVKALYGTKPDMALMQDLQRIAYTYDPSKQQ